MKSEQYLKFKNNQIYEKRDKITSEFLSGKKFLRFL